MSKEKDKLESRGKLRLRAENRIRSKTGATGNTGEADPLSLENRERLIHELQVHQIELEMQNDELRRTCRELETARARYVDLYDFSPVAYLTVSQNGLILEANLTAALLLGIERSNLLRRPFISFIHAEDREIYHGYRKALVEDASRQSDDLRMLRTDDSPFWANLKAIAAKADDGSFQYRVIVTDITARKRSEEALESSLADKDVLMRELAHRTKNNMQIIGSLINLRTAGWTDGKFTEAIVDIQDRIRAMALVYDNLCRSGNISSTNMKSYVKDLSNNLLCTHHGVLKPVGVKLDMEDLFVSIDAAVPLGLIINELITNSLKHAFPAATRGTIHISLRRKEEGVELRYRDDGPGLPGDLDLARIPSLGLKLVYNIAVGQLRGKMEIRREPAAEFVFTFGDFTHMERK